MPIEIDNTGIRAGQQTIEFSRFPGLRDYYLRTRPKTRCVEEKGAKLMKTDARDDAEVNCFVRSVFKWGGRTSGLVNLHLLHHHRDKENVANVLAQGIRGAIPLLKKGTCANAFDTITGIQGLGPSYGSKILRMLAPEKAAAYDSKLHKELDYGRSGAAYQQFCNDCLKVAKILNRNGYPRWTAADVEASIYGTLDKQKLR